VSKHGRTKLVPPKTEPEKNQVLETIEESSLSEQKEEPVLTELDTEIQCPRCNDVMELSSSFDALAYFCENCSFILKCV
jgi:Zn finger protein HypA/HybF involved in hydrogenase expression